MTFRRMIGLSLLLHAAVLAAAFAIIEFTPLGRRVFFVELLGPYIQSGGGGITTGAGSAQPTKKAQEPVRNENPAVSPSSPSAANEAKPPEEMRPAAVQEPDEDEAADVAVESYGDMKTAVDAVQAAGSPGLHAGDGGGKAAETGGTGDGGEHSMSGGGPLSLGGGEEGPPIGKIRQAIAGATEYPHVARLRRLEGVVVVSFTVKPDGMPGVVEVTRSSGSSILDNDAVDTVMRAAPFPAVGGRVVVPIGYRLIQQK